MPGTNWDGINGGGVVLIFNSKFRKWKNLCFLLSIPPTNMSLIAVQRGRVLPLAHETCYPP